MIGRIVKAALVVSFLVAVLTNGLLIAAIFGARLELGRARSQYGLPAKGQANAPFLGFDIDGAQVELSTDHRGTAVWYASRNCPYCRRDEQWTSLARALQDRGVRVIILLPGRADRFTPADSGRPKGALQVAFMNREWLDQFPLSVTPTLLIFDDGHRLVWHRRGMLSAADAASALRAAARAMR